MKNRLLDYLSRLFSGRQAEESPATVPPVEETPPLTTLANPKMVNYLNRLQLFQNMPPPLLDYIVEKMETHTLEKGEVLVRQGALSDSLFIIRTGWVKIVDIGANDEEVILNQVGPGQVIGEMALIDETPRSNTVVAISSVTALEIKYQVVLEILEKQPLLARNFLSQMSDRVRFANAYIGESIQWCRHIAAGDYDFVADQLRLTRSTIVDMSHSHQVRASAFLSAFFEMVEDLRQREEELKQQVRQLTIEIDEVKRQQTVQEITESEFFENLQSSVQELRKRRSHPEPKESRPEEE